MKISMRAALIAHLFGCLLLACSEIHDMPAEGGGSLLGSESDASVPPDRQPDPSLPNGRLPEGCALTFEFADPPRAGAGGQGGSGGHGGGAVSGQAGASSPEPMCRCTRRPGERESYRCPQGADQSVTQEVGPEGGSVVLDGTPSSMAAGVPVELVIPPGALDRTVTLRITETSIAPPEEIADWSPLYHLEPDDLRFESPVELRMPFASDDGLVPPHLAIHASELPGSCRLAPLRDSYINAGFSQATLPHLGWVIVGVSSTFESCGDAR